MEEAADEDGDGVEAPLGVGIVAILQLVLDDGDDGRSKGEANTSLFFEAGSVEEVR